MREFTLILTVDVDAENAETLVETTYEAVTQLGAQIFGYSQQLDEGEQHLIVRFKVNDDDRGVVTENLTQWPNTFFVVTVTPDNWGPMIEWARAALDDLIDEDGDGLATMSQKKRAELLTYFMLGMTDDGQLEDLAWEAVNERFPNDVKEG